MTRIIFIIVLIIAAGNLSAQNTDCQVNIPELSGTYQGGCKNGLAHGKGISKGTDSYEGQFIRGLPDGRGTYKWANGIYYQGDWKAGKREGRGKMVYPDSVVNGYWKNNAYIGKEQPVPYKITSTLSVARYSVNKTNEVAPGVRLRLMQGGMDNTIIEGFSMISDSGSEYKSGNYYGLENVRFPVNLKIKYRSWNQLRTQQFNVIFELEIIEPGTWEIILTN
jgi:hypothetical protein